MSCGPFTEEVMAPTLSGGMNRSSLYSQREGGMQPKRLGRAVSLHEGKYAWFSEPLHGVDLQLTGNHARTSGLRA